MVVSSGLVRCVDPGKGDAGHLGRRRKERAAVGAGMCQQLRAEAGSACLDDLFVSCCVEDPSSRVARVNTTLHQNSHSTPARSLHDVHVARCVQNSMNSLGDGAICVLGGTKSLSASTRTGGQAFCCVVA